MAKHLTARDVRFLASVERDAVRKIDDLLGLADELIAAGDAAGLEPDLAALEALDDDETLDDPDRLDSIRSDMRAQIGRIGRGEHLTTEDIDDV